MILNKITIRNFKSLQNKISIGPFAKGLNIVYGPNGIGKSTILSTLTQGLLSNHKSKAEKIQTLKPWGRDLNPNISIEFSNFDHKYKLEKQFLNDTYARLKLWHNERWEDIAEAEEAEIKLRNLWGQNPQEKTKGLADINDWGWKRLLLVPQNTINNIKLETNDFNSFLKLLGSASISQTEINFKELLTKRYEIFFTKTGKMKRKSGLVELDEIKEEILEIENHIDILENKYTTIEKNRTEIQKFETQLINIQKKVNKISYYLDKYITIENEYKKNEKNLLETKLKLEKLEKEIVYFKNLEENLKTEMELEEKLKKENIILNKEISEKKEKLNCLKFNINCCKINSLKEKEKELNIFLKNIEKEEKNLNKLIEKGKNLKAPTTEELNILKDLILKNTKNKETLEASELVISLNWPKIKIKPIKGKVTKNNDNIVEIRGLAEIEAEIETLGILKAYAKNNEAEKLQKDLEVSQKQLDTFWEKWDFCEIKNLERKEKERLELLQLHKQSKEKLSFLLNNKKTSFYNLEKDKIETEIKRLELTLNIVENKKIIIETTNLNLDELIEKYHLKKNNINIKKEKLKDNKKILEEKEKLILQYKNLIGPPLEAKRKTEQNLLYLDIEKIKEEDIKKKLVKPNKNITKIQLIWNNLLNQEKDCKDKINQLMVEINYLNQESVFSKKEFLKNKLTFLKEEYNFKQIEIKALKKVFDIYFSKRNYLDTYKANFLATKTEEIYQEFINNKFKNINFSNNLDEITLNVNNLPAQLISPTIYPEDLSLGEKDLLFLSIRLAAAELLSNNNYNFLLFDDVISNCDDYKLNILIEKLLKLSKKMQVILFTCHYPRVKNLKSVKYFNLMEIKENS